MTEIGSNAYTVYIYHESKNPARLARWEKIKATKSLKRAILYAKTLDKRKTFERIEIKERHFLKNHGCYADTTICAFRKNSRLWETLKNKCALMILGARCMLKLS